MFGTLFSNLRAENANEPAITRRRYSRRQQDHCVCLIGGGIYPVSNWSMGGVVITADGRTFAIDDMKQVQLKFKTSTGVIDITHNAHVIRKTKDTVAFEFEPINAKIRNQFQTVIDDYVSNRFSGAGGTQ